MKKILVTGSFGLIGSEVCIYFAQRGWQIHGIDNNNRVAFFGSEANSQWNRQALEAIQQHYTHYAIDIRSREQILKLFQEIKPQAIVHAAAQPSHDLAAHIPFDNFDINANGTLNLLEATRQVCPQAPFIFLSTNKVYGDGPNLIELKETATRWEFDDPRYQNGIAENFSIDQSLHSLFGASKLAADIMVQEYGRYFFMPTCCLRGGCLTGPLHAGVEMHGFLSYLTRCNLEQRLYRIYGYQGKQVRDNIHSYDVASFIEHFIRSPHCAETYNLGGGKTNSCSILEAFDITAGITGIPQVYSYLDQPRRGDHICYYSDLSKIKTHYPDWQITRPLKTIFEDIINSWVQKLKITPHFTAKEKPAPAVMRA